MSLARSNSRVAPNVLLGSTAEFQDLAARVGYYVLLLIACCSPWGDVFRLQMERGYAGRGLTTVFAIGVIVISVMSTKFFTAIISRPRVLFFAAFVLLGTCASFLQNVPIVLSLHGGFNRGGYWILMVAVMSLHLSGEKGRLYIRLFALSTALMSFVSLLDYFNVVDVPRFNEGYAFFHLPDDPTNSLIGRSMAGPFPTRAFLGAYLALAWPVPLTELIHDKLRNPLRMAMWASALLVLTFAVFVCYSRALYLMVAVVALYAIYTTRHLRILRIAFLVVPLLLVLFLVFKSKFPHEMEILVARIGSLAPAKIGKAGGIGRLGLFTKTLGEILENPLGMGFGMVEIQGTMRVVHSIITEHLRPAGLLGFVCVFLFAWPVLKMVISRRIPVGTMVLCSSLVGELAYGLAHSTHDMLGAWVVIGLLYALSEKRPGLVYTYGERISA